jgi:predicted DNA-binding mobile mystery protein A
MKNSLRQFQLQKIDQFLAKIPLFERPTHGWIHTIRKLLNIKTSQLSKKIGVSQQAISQFEKQELQNTITLKTLHSTAEALDCTFIYAFIPIEKTLQDTINKNHSSKP